MNRLFTECLSFSSYQDKPFSVQIHLPMVLRTARDLQPEPSPDFIASNASTFGHSTH